VLLNLLAFLRDRGFVYITVLFQYLDGCTKWIELIVLNT
jgi:hypothetical protein